MFKITKKSIEWGGRTLTLETGRIARQATGAVLVTYGETVVLCTATAAKEMKEGMDFFPLAVQYQEKTFAVGKIPGGFFKREARPSEKETLASRLIDRPIRPLFPAQFKNEVSVLCSVYSFDGKSDSEVAALIGASAALSISGLPFQGPIAAARVGYDDGEYILNIDCDAEKTDLDLIVSATKDSVMMVESEANCLSQEVMLGAVAFGHEQMQPVIELIEQFKAEAGKEAWEVKTVDNSAIETKLEEIAAAKIAEAYAIRDKQARVIKISAARKEALAQFSDEEQNTAAGCFKALEKKTVRSNLIETGERIDGRGTTEVRNILIETGLLPRAHGSSLFTRGETQSITAATLGTSQDEQRMETLEGEYSERFLLHYNFPPFSVGEPGMVRGAGRREIGHGKLAQRALRALMPTKEEFPYTIRLVSEITESNGSSSMATVCASSLAMMDAGVPLREHVSGIAMGLIKEGDKYVVLSDILGDEDYLGDMDFKVAGTKDGITALQMDIKINGITQEIMTNALEQANEGRLHILGKMQEAIEGSRESLSEFAPVIKTLQINKDKIRDVIGSGGKVIKEICEVSGAKVDIDDTGKISVSAVGKESLETALEMIKNITMELKVGMVLEGKVARIVDFGAFVTLPNKQDGLLHISEIANKRLESVTEVLSESEVIKVKIAGIERGKIKLSMKNINQETGEETSPQPKEKAPRPEKSEKKPSNNNSDNSGNTGGSNSPKGADDENLKNIMSSSKRKRKFFGGE